MSNTSALTEDLRLRELTGELEQKVAELKKSEERYHKMIEEVEDYAIILLDHDGIIRNWNRGAEKIKGYKEEEIVGRSFQEFYLPQDRESGLPIILINKAREEGKAVHEGWRLRKDGSAFWGSIVLTALHGVDNEIIGFSKVTRDLTERKLAEDQLRDYASQLEFQNKELQQFAYAASHDMKEPLRKIHLYNSYILENPANVFDEKSKDFMARSVKAVSRMTQLIEDLLMYSKTTANLDSFEAVDLNELLEEIKHAYRDTLDTSHVTIESEPLPSIDGVRFQLKQLLDNLIANSIKYRHPDRNPHISIHADLVPGSRMRDKDAEKDSTYYRISIRDNGIGFEPQYSEKVFDIFQRLGNQPGSKGSGIGLAICKKIVQNHKGFIHAKGRPDEGAQFDIYLPQP